MFRKKSSLILLVSLVLGLVACQPEADVRIIPVEDFFKKPASLNYAISPDGKNIAYLKNTDGLYNIFVRPVDKLEEKQISYSEKDGIESFDWINHNTLIFKTTENDSSKLQVANTDNFSVTTIFADKGISIKILNILPRLQNQILIAVNNRNRKIFDVYRLNLINGTMELVHENPGNYVEWVADNNGRVKIAIATDGTRMVVYSRPAESEQFEPLLSTAFDEQFYVKGFTPDNKYIYAISNLNKDKSALIVYDFENNRSVSTLYENPFVDVKDVLLLKTTGEAIGVSYIDWKPEARFFNESEQKFQSVINGMTGTSNSFIVSRDNKNEKFIIKTSSDKSAGSYFYYDKTTDEFTKLADTTPWFEESEMADMKPVSYKSRDGFTIHGYLIFPRNVKPNKLPTVVVPHGGLWSREIWGFNKEAQIFANRGFAVFIMNYRGSTGYGKQFRQAGYKQWGQKIQDDITDGVDWLIKQEIADPGRIAIVGKSFGGYSALMGLALNPDMYTCGVACCAIADQITFLNSVPSQWEPFRKILAQIIGDPLKDKEFLKKYSPNSNADKIIAPVFFVHGEKDTKADIHEVKKMVSILQDKGIEVKTMFKETEGHGLKIEENEIEYLKSTLVFLQKHLDTGLINK